MLLCTNYISIALIQSKIRRDVMVGDGASDHRDPDHEEQGHRGREGISSEDTGTLAEVEDSGDIHSLTHCQHF